MPPDLPGAVRTLTLNAARAVGMEQTGAIWPGFRADLILVEQAADGNPEVQRVFREGREVFTLNAPALVGVTS